MKLATVMLGGRPETAEGLPGPFLAPYASASRRAPDGGVAMAPVDAVTPPAPVPVAVEAVGRAPRKVMVVRHLTGGVATATA